MSEKEIVNLIKKVKENFPNEFYETIGYMRGLKKGMEIKKERELKYVQQGTKES